MSLYSRQDERNIRVQRMVTDWAKSGLLQDEQRDRMMADLTVDLRRTNKFLRITLFLFGFLIVNATTGLFALFLDLDDSAATWFALIAALASVALSQMLVRRYRLYHFGIEEAAAIAAVAFAAVFAGTVIGSSFSTIAAFAAASAGAFALFQRFGYVYAGVAATLLAPMIVFDLEQSDTLRRLLAAIVLLTIFFLARERREDYGDDYPGDAYGVVEAVAWGALYVVTNLKISDWVSLTDNVPAFYWATYALTWILPAAGLWLAIRDRHRLLLDVNILMVLVTLMTNKAYLGAERNPWDPIVFGIVLIATALGIRRWLAGGAGESRAGYTASRLLASERAHLEVVGTASVVAPGAPQSHPQDSPSIGGGGSSGGAGASGNF